MTLDAQRLQTYLLLDRQWKQQDRIAHARYMLGRALISEWPFWNAVLAANGAKP